MDDYSISIEQKESIDELLNVLKQGVRNAYTVLRAADADVDYFNLRFSDPKEALLHERLGNLRATLSAYIDELSALSQSRT